MVEESVGRTRSVAGMAGFAGRPKDQPPTAQPRRREAETARQGQDEVCLHAGEDVALRLLRERVLAATRAAIGVDHAARPAFAELVDTPEAGDFLGRLIAAQHQLAAPCHGRPDLRVVLADAFDRGVLETVELLQDAGPEALAAIERVAAEAADRRGREGGDAGA